jgi:hypothetical protein
MRCRPAVLGNPAADLIRIMVRWTAGTRVQSDETFNPNQSSETATKRD